LSCNFHFLERDSRGEREGGGETEGERIIYLQYICKMDWET
jgi:hypothetical protein